MAERYKKLQLLGENMWCKNCPVLLYKGVLLHDNQVDKNLLQLGFVSMSDRVIAGLEIRYKGYSLGNELMIEDVFSYLDLTIGLNEQFGGKTPVYVKNDNARKFFICISKIYFNDGEIWENTVPLQSLNVQEDLRNKLNVLYDEFVRLYNRQDLCRYLFVPQISEKVWRCTCGTLNLKNRRCRYCGIEQSSLIKMLNPDYLQNSRNEYQRIEKERIQQEKKEIEKNKQIKIRMYKKIATLTLMGIILVVSYFCIEHYILEPKQHIKNAEEYLNSQNFEEANSEYLKAYGTLENDDVSMTYYNLCIKYLETEDYENARICYKYINDITKKQDEKINILWKDSCLRKSYLTLQEFEERYGCIKKENVLNDEELNNFLIERGNICLNNLNFYLAKKYFFKVSIQYEKKLQDTIFATVKKLIKNGKYEVVENCLEYLSKAQIKKLNKKLKKIYDTWNGLYSDDGLLRIRKYLVKNKIISGKFIG